MSHLQFRTTALAVLAATASAAGRRPVDRQRAAIQAWLDGCPLPVATVRSAVAFLQAVGC